MAVKDRKLPDVLSQDFVICDNTINRYGWRLLVEGIDLTGFLKNPVCCYIHNTYSIPVGKWTNIRVENGQMLGTLIFDANDPDAVKLYWKYADGFMSAVSLNIIPIAESEDPSMLLPGQKYPTVVKSEMLEISVVTVPGQKNAVKLTTPDGNVYKLNLVTKLKTDMAKEEKSVEQLNAELAAQKKLNAENLVKMHQIRGVVQDAEVEPLRALALNDYENVQKMLDARVVSKPAVTPAAGTESNSATLAAQLVELHAERLGLNPEEKAFYSTAALTAYEATKKALEMRKGKEALQSFVNNQELGGGNAGEDRSKWGYLDFYKKDPSALETMRLKEPEKFKRLEAQFYDESKRMGILTTAEE